MTIKELKDFIKDCDDDDFVTVCCCPDDDPTSDYYDVDVVYKISTNKENRDQICLMPQ